MATLAKERSHWLDRPDHLIRAARHYEGAAQIMIRHAVMTAKMVSIRDECVSPASVLQSASTTLIFFFIERLLHPLLLNFFCIYANILNFHMQQ